MAHCSVRWFDMPLSRIKFRPGVNRESTSFADQQGWFDSDLIRFRKGYPEKIGGWVKVGSSSVAGTVRSLKVWVTLSALKLMGVGTTSKFYIEQGQAFYDVTPIRATTTDGITFAATNGSSTITATDSTHGAVEGDFVTISGAVSLGGLVTVLNQEYEIVSVPTTNTFTFVAKDTSGATVTANSSDSGNGGSGADAAYQINIGLNTQVGGTGWGAGTWGAGGWGQASNQTTVAELRLWSQDNFGEDLVINPRDGGIFYWDKSDAVTNRAVEVGALSGTTDTPSIAKQVMVSNDRHVIAFGTNPLGATAQDPLLIRFSDRENILDWEPKATNTAGDLRIASGSQFVRAIKTKREIIIYG